MCRVSVSGAYVQGFHAGYLFLLRGVGGGNIMIPWHNL